MRSKADKNNYVFCITIPVAKAYFPTDYDVETTVELKTAGLNPIKIGLVDRIVMSS